MSCKHLKDHKCTIPNRKGTKCIGYKICHRYEEDIKESTQDKAINRGLEVIKELRSAREEVTYVGLRQVLEAMKEGCCDG